MKFNKLILISILLVIISISAVNATDNENLTVQTATNDIADEMSIMQSGDENSVEHSQVNLDESMLKDSQSFVINSDTFDSCFDGEGRILDAVPEGAILDFQGQITASDTIKAIYINKSVNIISSTNDATITLNTVNGTLGKENIANRFIIDGVSSITISNVVFNRTQILIFGSANVILDNVGIISDNYGVVNAGDSARIAETPLVKIENITGFTLKDSYIYVYNLGSRLIGCIDVKDLVFDNNAFYVRAESIQNDKRTERIISFMSNEEGGIVDTSVNITNNRFDLNYTTFSNSHINANNILFENNTFEHPNITNIVSAVKFYLKGVIDGSSIIVKNNKFPYLSVTGQGVVYNNSMKYVFSGVGSLLIYNNTIGDNLNHNFDSSVGVGSNSIFYNNSLFGTVRIMGSNVTVKDSVMNGIVTMANMKNITIKNNDINRITNRVSDAIYESITVQSTETFINNNTIKGSIAIKNPGNCELNYNTINGAIVIESKSSIIRHNTINAPFDDYSITIVSDKNYINNEIFNNKIYSKRYCGDGAVLYDENYLNFVEDNTPKTQIDMFVNNTVNTFDYGGNTTIKVNMKDMGGYVTIDVDGDKYVVELVNGEASFVLTKYAVGLNNVTVIYYDVVSDVWAIKHTNFTVNKVNYCPVELIYSEISEGEFSDINFILPNDANGSIFITLTNGIYTINIEKVAMGSNNEIKLPGLPEGNYYICATFISEKYVTNSSDGTISFVHIPEYKISAIDIVMDYKDESKYKVLVTKDGKHVGSGEIVKITFNGKNIEIKTDKEGYATLPLDAAPKIYTIKAEYNGVTKSTKVTIKNILKSNNVSKKKTKNIKFTATLKNSKGKAIVGKKIIFKLKGKTYSAKTNKKGVATITLKNLKVGKYIITSKYGECTVKSIMRIKNR